MTTGTPTTPEMVGRTCPYCRFDLKEGVTVIPCPVCEAVHHDDCWEENGGCAVALCAGGPSYEEAPQQEPEPEPEPPAPPPLPPVEVSKPESPVAPAQPPPPPGPPPPRSGTPSRSRWIPFIAAAIVLLGGATAAAIVLTRHHSDTTTASASSGEFEEASEFEGEDESYENEGYEEEGYEDESYEEEEAASLTPGERAQRQIQAALTTHFNHLAAGDYETAWEDLDAHEQDHIGSESGWTEEEEADNLRSFDLRVNASLEGSNAAEASIVEFRTRSSLTGCHEWTGYWEMSKVYGEWLIGGVELERESC